MHLCMWRTLYWTPASLQKGIYNYGKFRGRHYGRYINRDSEGEDLKFEAFYYHNTIQNVCWRSRQSCHGIEKAKRKQHFNKFDKIISSFGNITQTLNDNEFDAKKTTAEILKQTQTRKQICSKVKKKVEQRKTKERKTYQHCRVRWLSIFKI